MIKMKPTPSQDYLNQCLDYNPVTGVFTWKARPLEHFVSYHGMRIWNGKYAGRTAGSLWENNKGKRYLRISISKNSFKAHRLAVTIMNGSIDQTIEVDHKDGNGLNNKWRNLRLVSKSTNMQNTRLRSDNTSGTVGVSYYKAKDQWRARIYVNGHELSLGYFNKLSDAVEARRVAEIKYGYHENHGSIRPL